MTALCPQCRSVLQVHKAGEEVQPEDRIVCPVHGDIGSYAEFEPAIKEAAAEEARRLIQEVFRNSGFKLN